MFLNLQHCVVISEVKPQVQGVVGSISMNSHEYIISHFIVACNIVLEQMGHTQQYFILILNAFVSVVVVKANQKLMLAQHVAVGPALLISATWIDGNRHIMLQIK